MENIICEIKRLYFANDKISGSVWKLNTYEKGSISVLCGCYFDNSIVERAKLLLPGDEIRLTDAEMTKRRGRGGSEFEYIIIRDFEPVHLIEGRSI